MPFTHEGNVRIDSEVDIVAIRKVVRQVSSDLGFGVTDVTRIVTAASELARNIYHYANSGNMYWKVTNSNLEKAIELTFIDQGPGIEDIDQALKMGYTTRGGLGLGLPGAKRLMDEMEIESEQGKGTTVAIKKWLKKN
jgi:serine/threonine-protein kinase RsbT